MSAGAYGRRATAVVLSVVMVLSMAPVAVAGGGAGAPVSLATTLVVDDDGAECGAAGYTTIQGAVDAAAPGDTIQICPGTYRENVTVDVSDLRIVGDPGDATPGPGPGAPVLDGDGTFEDAIVLVAGVSNVTVEGIRAFNYTDGPKSGLPSGIVAESGPVSGITVLDSRFEGFRDGVYSIQGVRVSEWRVGRSTFYDVNYPFYAENVDDVVAIDNRIYYTKPVGFKGFVLPVGWGPPGDAVATATVRDNVVEVNDQPSGRAFFAYVGGYRDNLTFRDAVFENNTIRNVNATGGSEDVYGLYLENDGGAGTVMENVSFVGNRVLNANGTEVRGVYYVANDGGGSNQGIDGLRIANNEYRNFTGDDVNHGVHFDLQGTGNPMVNVTVENNVVADFSGGDSITTGVYYEGEHDGGNAPQPDSLSFEGQSLSGAGSDGAEDRSPRGRTAGATGDGLVTVSGDGLVTGSSVGSTDVGTLAVSPTVSRNLRILDNEFTDFAGDAFLPVLNFEGTDGSGIDGLYIERNRIERIDTVNSEADGIVFSFPNAGPGVTDLRIRDNTIADLRAPTAGQFASAILVFGGPITDAVIERNRITRNRFGFELFEGDYRNVRIEGNEILDNREAGLYFYGNAEVSQFRVQSNVIAGNARFGVFNGNTTGGVYVDARENYWGAADGPGSPRDPEAPFTDPVTGRPANGSGDNVTDYSGFFGESLSASSVESQDVASGPGVSNVRFDPFLEAPAAANFSVTVLATNSPVTAGSPARFTARVENVGGGAGTGAVTLTVRGSQQDSTDVTLGAGDSTTVTLVWATTAFDVGVFTGTVATPDDSDAADVRVGGLAFGAVDRGECRGDEPKGDDWTDSGDC